MEEQSVPNVIAEHLKPIIGVLATLLIFSAAGIGGYLVQQRQIFAPKAAKIEVPQTPKTSILLEGPSSATIGESFTVKVKIRSDIDAANLFTAKLQFSPDILEVISINDSDEVISAQPDCKRSGEGCSGDNCCQGYLCQAFTGGSFKCVAEITQSASSSASPVILANPRDQNLSATDSGVIVPPPQNDKITKVSSPTDSFIQTWVEKTYDNKSGLITITGGVPSPGFKTDFGKDALMAEVTFKVKNSGPALVEFSSGTAIYRNSDNINILDSRNELNLTINIPGTITQESSASGSKNDQSDKINEPSLTDMSVLLSNWDKSTASSSSVDLNQDGKINSLDYALMVKQLQKSGVTSPSR